MIHLLVRALRTLYRNKWKTQWSQFFTLMCQSAYNHKVDNWRMLVGFKKSITRGKLGEQSQSMGLTQPDMQVSIKIIIHINIAIIIMDGSVHPDMQISPKAACFPSPVPPSTNMINSNKGKSQTQLRLSFVGIWGGKNKNCYCWSKLLSSIKSGLE